MRKYTLGMGALLLTLMLGPPGKLKAGTVGVTLNNGGSNVMGGVYTGPYNLTVTVGSQNTPVQLVCDDAFDEVYAGEQWQASTSTFPSLSNVQFKSGNYQEAGWLVQQLFANAGNATTSGEIQWALWDVFDPGISNTDPWGSLTSAEKTAISGYLTDAMNYYNGGNFSGLSNLVIYTAVPGTQSNGDGLPQEFFGINTPQNMPEPMTLWSLLVALGAIALAYKWADKTTVESPASARM